MIFYSISSDTNACFGSKKKGGGQIFLPPPQVYRWLIKRIPLKPQGNLFGRFPSISADLRVKNLIGPKKGAAKFIKLIHNDNLLVRAASN
jgi:hypothetical protein